MNWFPFTYILDNLITNSIHAWLTKDYRSSGMSPQVVEMTLLIVLLTVVVFLPRSLATLSGLEILLTMNPPNLIREAFSFQFCGNRSSIHWLVDLTSKHYGVYQKQKNPPEIMKICTENIMQKWTLRMIDDFSFVCLTHIG